MKKSPVVAYIILGLALATFASAHGAVNSQRRAVDPYLIEFEYNNPGNVMVGDYTTYFFRLLDLKTEEPIPFDSAFIRIEKKNGPAILSGNQAQDQVNSGVASLSAVLPNAGVYQANLSFQKNEKEITNASFEFSVDPAVSAGSTNKPNNLYLVLLSVGGGVILGLAVYKSFFSA